VGLEVPAADAAAAQACQRLAAALPELVEGQRRRDTEPSSPLTAAWGAPAITLRCGVDSPAAYEPTALLDVVNDVGWFREELPEATRFTAMGRAARVEVVVPEEYEPAVNPLVDLAAAVATVPEA
jgi:hypothetical protein